MEKGKELVKKSRLKGLAKKLPVYLVAGVLTYAGGAAGIDFAYNRYFSAESKIVDLSQKDKKELSKEMVDSLNSSGIPRENVRGLEITVSDFGFLDNSSEGGAYFPSSSQIRLPSYDWERSLVHEVGHHVYDHVLSEEQKGKFRKRGDEYLALWKKTNEELHVEKDSSKRPYLLGFMVPGVGSGVFDDPAKVDYDELFAQVYDYYFSSSEPMRIRNSEDDRGRERFRNFFSDIVVKDVNTRISSGDFKVVNAASFSDIPNLFVGKLKRLKALSPF